MYEFNYHKAGSVADAAAMLSKHPEARLLAGGQTLIAAMKLRLASPSDVVDLSGIKELSGIKVDGGGVTVGAGVNSWSRSVWRRENTWRIFPQDSPPLCRRLTISLNSRSATLMAARASLWLGLR